MCPLRPLLYSFDGLYPVISSQNISWACCTLQTHCIQPPTQPPPSWDRDSDAETPAHQCICSHWCQINLAQFCLMGLLACKYFGSSSKSQVHKNHSQYSWKCAEGGIESQNQLHSPVSKTRADLEKYYKTLPLAPAGQCHYRQRCCSQILFHWLPCPFSSPSSEAHFLSLLLHGRIVSLEIHSDEEE